MSPRNLLDQVSKIGFIQGRLCNQVDGQIQAFPWQDWETEFPVANALSISLMEWTLDQDRLYENPLMTATGQDQIRQLCDQYGLAIPSLTGDCFMQAPFWKAVGSDRVKLQEDFQAICRACTIVGIQMVVVPLVDNGRLETSEQEDILVEYLLSQQSNLANLGVSILFESDFSPTELSRFINQLPSKQFGVNYDIGNSAALGLDPREEFSAYGHRVMNVHVKDRVLGGTTVPLGAGNADFETVFESLAHLNYSGNFILQTARATDGDHAGVLARYRDLTQAWIVGYGLAGASK
ncbi:TIM barrel protein [Phormidium sp. FACHB-1136]|uniref:sugar phosphate isomerase/epimerase family protein n=1 Tax=Phormidium sp. FACHB-1136 TaxID=2692848 RepID=UPI001686A9EA|nr:TIM barrel protein [Phormidium sp. FACHB-1136]MBD2424553.1 sugar phosphate isomerase/epimerase [Phormidium sp. FACHB-1136]